MSGSNLKFLKTCNPDTKTQLLKIGYTLFSEDNGVFIFINNEKLSFDKNEIKNVAYSNMLTF